MSGLCQTCEPSAQGRGRQHCALAVLRVSLRQQPHERQGISQGPLLLLAWRQIAGGGYRLLSAETAKLALTEHAIETDIVTGRSGRRGLGIYLTESGSGVVECKLPAGNVGWDSGRGGSIMVMDSDRRLTLAYAMNRVVPSEEHPSPAAFLMAVYEIFGVSIAA